MIDRPGLPPAPLETSAAENTQARPGTSGPAQHWTRRRWLAAAMAAPLGGVSFSVRGAGPDVRVPVLVYHRVAATAVDSMTVRAANFAAHLRLLHEAGCSVIPLADLVAYRLGRLEALPARSVALSIDDGHRSVMEHMEPLLAPYGWPVTLFIYPSAISNASYAMRWDDLRRLQATGRYSVQSHTYWHPNLVKERRAQAPEAFQRFAQLQLQHSRQVLQERLGRPVSLLSWPFGLTDAGLMAQAAQIGYEGAFSLGERPCTRHDPVLALPRYLMVDAVDERRLRRLLDAAHAPVETSS